MKTRSAAIFVVVWALVAAGASAGSDTALAPGGPGKAAAASAGDETYLSTFYTPGDVIVFTPEAGTAVSLRDASSTVVWTKLSVQPGGEVENVTGLAAGFYRVTSNKKIVVMTGDLVSGGGSHTRSYYARDVDGKGIGTELYTYLRAFSEEDAPKLYVFSHQNSNTVTVSRMGEFKWEQVWTGTLGNGFSQAVTMSTADHLQVTSTGPVSALVAGSDHYDDPGAHCVPAISSGSFYGDLFSTWLPGGEAYVYAFDDGTHIELEDTFAINPPPRASWDLDAGEVGSYAVPSTEPFEITVQSSKPIAFCRMYQDLAGANGMHYLPAKSGTMIGTEFVIDANHPIEVIAYDNTTQIEYTRRNGTVHGYTLNAGDHQALPGGTAGRLTALKAVSVVSRATIGATFVPIPVTALDTAPGPPAIFAVRHDPPSPTVSDTNVWVKWATDEPCSSCMTYRRNGGAWSSPTCIPLYGTQANIPIGISSFAADDTIEYFVTSTDKDNNSVVDNNGGSYYSFTISDKVPQLSVSRLSVLSPATYSDGYTVNLMIENTGLAEARNVRIRERLSGMISPTAATTLVAATTRELDLTIPVPDIPAGEFRTVSYELTPMLYGTYSTYGIGLSTPSTVTYRSKAGRSFSSSFSSSATVSSTEALHWIRGQDYVVATNIGRLRALYGASNAGAVLEEAAIFALAREAVVAELETTNRYAIEKLIDSSWNGRLGFIGHGGWQYLLFLGSRDVVPTFHVTHKCSGDGPREAPMADNIYADVATGDHFKPELVIGRLPGEDANRLVTQLRNSLSPVSDDEAILMSGTGDGETSFVNAIDDADGFLGQYTTHVKRHWKDEPQQSARWSTFLADATDTDLVIYRDHGLKWCWGNHCEVHTMNLSSLDFGTKHPMVWSIACLTGGVDENPSLAEVFLDQGASLFIGATEVSARRPNNVFLHHLAKLHSMSAYYPTMGEVFKWAKHRVIDDIIYFGSWCYTDARAKQLLNEYNLYGDPKRYEAPLAATSKSSAPAAGEGPPPDVIDLELQDYEVTVSEDGTDLVTLPGDEGGTWAEDGQPIVPIAIHRHAFGPGYKVTDVTLEERDGLVTESGLVLPIASYADDDGTAPPAKSVAAKSTVFPPPGTQYDWTLEEQLDGSHVLLLKVFPFYYDTATTESEFYRDYRFGVTWNDSATEIIDILPSQEVYPLGDPVDGLIDVDHGGAPIEATLEIEMVDQTSNEVVTTSDPQSIGLDDGSASFDFGLALDADAPGAYLLRARLTNGDDLLDEATAPIRVGRLSAVGESLAVSPDPASGFEIGDIVTISAWFDSTCPNQLSGRARVQVVDIATSDIVHLASEEVTLDPGGSLEIDTAWDTSAAAEGSYRVSAMLEYDGLSTEPMTADLFTLRHMAVSLSTDRQVYDIGDKVVVWAEFTGADGGPLEVTPTVQLALPDASTVPLQMNQHGELGVSSGWHFLTAGSPEGAYGVALTAEAAGYHSGSAQHVFSVGGAPPTPGFSWSPPSPGTGADVQFTDTSTGSPGSWSWSFGDGAVSSQQHPVHAFQTAGDFEVTLQVANAFGTSWTTQTVTVVPGPPQPIFADGFESGNCERWSLEVP